MTLQPGFELGLGFHDEDRTLFWRGIVRQLKATTRVVVATRVDEYVVDDEAWFMSDVTTCLGCIIGREHFF